MVENSPGLHKALDSIPVLLEGGREGKEKKMRKGKRAEKTQIGPIQLHIYLLINLMCIEIVHAVDQDWTMCYSCG